MIVHVEQARRSSEGTTCVRTHCRFGDRDAASSPAFYVVPYLARYREGTGVEHPLVSHTITKYSVLPPKCTSSFLEGAHCGSVSKQGRLERKAVRYLGTNDRL
jgi:hypothetical protein